jgi:AcrR family transcriptional regulator
MRPPTAIRGAATRDALLDAAELLVATHGFTTPSHRMIAGEAGTHVALVNYHFGSKEMLFEAALERRAPRLNAMWRDALAQVRAHPARSVGDVLRAWWRPFADVPSQRDGQWGNYLCAFGRLGNAPEGEAWYQRYFGSVDREFLDALSDAMPHAQRADVEAAFRYARTLLCEVLLYRCGKMGQSCRPPGFRDEDVERTLRFVEAGMLGIAAHPAASITAGSAS